MKSTKYFMLLVMSISTLISHAQPLKLYSKSFPIGLYSVDPANDQNFASIKSIGVDYIHTYKMGDDSKKGLALTQKYLDLAQKHKLKVMFNLRSRVWARKKNGVEELRELVRRFKNHPAIGFWYVYDEPPLEMLPKLKKIYEMLKEESPDIPVALVISWVKGWNKFGIATDILMIDNYPVQIKNFPHARINTITDFIQTAFKVKKIVIPVFQAVNRKICPDKENVYEKSLYRFPNWQEERFWAFSSLCFGVRGHFYYSFYNAKYRCNGEKWLTEVLGRVTKEVREFTTIVAKAWPPASSQYLEKEKLYVGTWHGKKKSFLIITNNSSEERHISVPINERFKLAELTPWGETRKISINISKGILTIKNNVKPWEVFIWQTNNKRNMEK